MKVEMKLKRLFVGLMIAFVLNILAGSMAFAQTETSVDSAGNVFVSGEDVNYEAQKFFSGFGTGKDVSVKNSESKDVVALAGYNLDLTDVNIGSSAFLAGYDLSFNQVNANGNLVGAGYSITVDENCSSNSVMLAGNHVTFSGVANSAHIYAENVKLEGTVNGDAVICANKVEIGDDAVVTGELKVVAVEEPVVPASAKIENLNFEQAEKFVDDKNEEAGIEISITKKSFAERVLDQVKSSLYWIVSMVILGLILCFLFPNQLNAAVGIGKNHKGAWIGSGIATLIGTPILAILVGITFVGLPVAVMMVGFYGLFLAMAVAFTGAVVGRGLIGRINPTVSSLIGIVVFEIFMKVPYVGFLLRMCCAVFMLGFVIQYVWRNRIVKSHSTEVVIAE